MGSPGRTLRSTSRKRHCLAKRHRRATHIHDAHVRHTHTMHTWAFDATQSRTGRQGFGWRALMYGVRYRFICICTVIFPTTWSLRSVESHAVSANSLGLYPQTSAARLRDEMKYMHVCCIAILYKSEK